MNKEAQAYLSQLLALAPQDFNESQAAFLRARRSYLTPDELETFKDIIDGTEKKAVENEVKMPELKKQAKELGIKVPFAIKKEALQQLIAEAQAE